MTSPAGQGLVRRYLHAVESALPQPLRGDVTREIASLVEDKLEERAGDGVRTEAMVIAVLIELGDPREVARRFDTRPRYLVGPDLFPLFERITKIILAGAFGIAVLVTALPRLVTPNPWEALLSFGTLGKVAIHTYNIGLALFAQLVVTFYLLQIFRVKAPDLTGPFDPEDLPELPGLPELRCDEVTFLDLAGRVGGLSVIAVLVNLIPGGFFSFGQSSLSLADFGIVLPVTLVNAWILFGIGLAFVARSVGRWTLWLRGLDLAVRLFGVFVLYALVDGSTVHAPAAQPHLAPLAQLLGRILPFIPVLALFGIGVELLGVVRSHLRRSRSAKMA